MWSVPFPWALLITRRPKKEAPNFARRGESLAAKDTQPSHAMHTRGVFSTKYHFPVLHPSPAHRYPCLHTKGGNVEGAVCVRVCVPPLDASLKKGEGSKAEACATKQGQRMK
jgi:hypothetical protein